MLTKLELFIEKSAIDADVIEVSGDTATVEQAARSLNVSDDQIVKSLVFRCDEDFVVAVIGGHKRVDTGKLAEVLECENVEIASPDEVEQATGYSVGNVPPVGYDVIKVVDEKVLDNREVYGGGGDEEHMIRMDPRFILGEKDTVADIGGGR